VNINFDLHSDLKSVNLNSKWSIHLEWMESLILAVFVCHFTLYM